MRTALSHSSVSLWHALFLSARSLSWWYTGAKMDPRGYVDNETFPAVCSDLRERRCKMTFSLFNVHT